MKAFRVKDENGREYDVSEVEEVKTETAEDIQTKDDESALTSDEIVALKKLAAVADKLVDLLKVEAAEHEATDVTDEDEDEDDSNETVVDTDEKSDCSTKDSVGSIEKITANDSVDIQEEIADCWNKRYNGGNR